MANTNQSKWMNRLNGILGLFIGIFGALAILGVFFKIANYPNWEIMMAVGFIGEAGAFIVMGIFAFIGGFTARDEAPAAPAAGVAGQAAPGPGIAAAYGEAHERAALAIEESSDEFREAMRATTEDFRRDMHRLLASHLAADFQSALEGVSRNVDHLGEELTALSGELEHARRAVHTMRGTLEQTATGRLPEDAARLGQGMQLLADGMTETGGTVERLHRDIEQMAYRFHAFNGSGSNGQDGHMLPPASATGDGAAVVAR